MLTTAYFTSYVQVFRFGGPLATDTDFAAAHRAFEKCRSLPIVIGDTLPTMALEVPQRFNRDATIWFEVKHHDGNLGAF